MFYKIIAANSTTPDQPNVYAGGFVVREGESPFLTALAAEFGDNYKDTAVDQLDEWSGGMVRTWCDELRNGYDPDKEHGIGEWPTWIFDNDGTTFYVSLSDRCKMEWTEQTPQKIVATGTKGVYLLKENGPPWVWNIYLNDHLILARGTLSSAKGAAQSYDDSPYEHPFTE